MQKTSVYIDKRTKEQILTVAETEHRKIADTIRYLLDLYRATTPVERAHLLSRQQEGG
jgi:hypothetical protein